MWNELHLSPPFHLNYMKQHRHHILVTDFIRIWEIYLSEDDFLKCLLESNIGLEMEEDELIQKGIELLSHTQDLKKISITHDDTSLVLSMIMSFGFPFKLKLKLKEGSRELFFNKITQPALKIICDLKSSENELRTILKKKDQEIEEYKSMGGKIRYTALPKYNDELHMKKHSTYNSYFGQTEISNNLLKLTEKDAKESDVDKIESDRPIKMEPESQNIVSNQPLVNRLTLIKQECIKNELPTVKKRKCLNI